MLWPPIYTYVQQLPVACLQPRPRPSRHIRRSNRFGKPTLDDKLHGRLTPKQMREAGL